MIDLTTFLGIALALIIALYTRKIFEVESTFQALALIGIVSLLGATEVLWIIPTIVRHFTS
jgi:hypothetical protein